MLSCALAKSIRSRSGSVYSTRGTNTDPRITTPRLSDHPAFRRSTSSRPASIASNQSEGSLIGHINRLRHQRENDLPVLHSMSDDDFLRPYPRDDLTSTTSFDVSGQSATARARRASLEHSATSLPWLASRLSRPASPVTGVSQPLLHSRSQRQTSLLSVHEDHPLPSSSLRSPPMPRPPGIDVGTQTVLLSSDIEAF